MECKNTAAKTEPLLLSNQSFPAIFRTKLEHRILPKALNGLNVVTSWLPPPSLFFMILQN